MGENTENTENKEVENKEEKPVVTPENKPSETVLPETKPEEKPEEKPTTEGETTEENNEEPVAFDPTQWSEERDEVADSVFELLHEGGATPDEAKALLFDAVQSGKIEDIDKDALVEKVGKARANLIMTGVKSFIKERADKTAAAVSAVHKAAGGEKAWEQVAKWVRENKPEGLDEYRAMIDAGGKQADLAVAALVKLHNADPKTKSIGKTEIIGDGPSTQRAEGISQREYGDRLNKLQRQGKATDEARSELLRLRRLGREQGK